jgi:hypothetical protein
MNTGLEVMENHRLDDVVYFADKEDVYSMQLFDHLCHVSYPFDRIFAFKFSRM